jgi:hypothetical protein
VKRYNRFLSNALKTGFFLVALGFYLLMLMVESVFPQMPIYEDYRDRMKRLRFRLPLDVMRWCGLSEVVIRLALLCGIMACCGGILGMVFGRGG